MPPSLTLQLHDTLNRSRKYANQWINQDKSLIVAMLKNLQSNKTNHQFLILQYCPEHLQQLGLLLKFVEARLVSNGKGMLPLQKFQKTFTKNKTATFARLYDVRTSDTQKQGSLRADRSIFQRLMISDEAGREIYWSL